MILIGRNYTNYGLLQNENFVRLMENFADTAPPGQSVGTYALAGQLWFDTANSTMQYYDGALWWPVSGSVSSNVAPSTTTVGYQWWDNVNNQLKVWNGTSYSLVGPAYSATDGLSGAVVQDIYDTVGAKHTTVFLYTNNNVIGVISYDATFTPNVAITGFSGNIVPGINLISSAVLNGTATNASSLNNVPASNYIRNDIAVGLASTLTVQGNISTNGGYFQVNGSTLSVQNTNLNGSINLITNVNSSNITALNVDGNTGYVTVAYDPVGTTGVATKNYVDTVAAATLVSATNEATTLLANVNALQIDVDANITYLWNNAASTNSNVSALQYTTAFLLAPNASPALTGIPTAPTASMWANSTQIATTYYVDEEVYYAMNYANALVASSGNSLLARLEADEATFAPNASPQFTGTPVAPTPTSGDVSTKIATTAFVAGTMPYWSGPDQNGNQVNSQRFISTSAPDNSLGNNGDFWFQIAG
jgi:hypothetical protein